MTLKRAKTIELWEEDVKAERRGSVQPRQHLSREPSLEAESEERRRFKLACEKIRDALPKEIYNQTKTTIPTVDQNIEVPSVEQKLESLMDELLLKVQVRDDPEEKL